MYKTNGYLSTWDLETVQKTMPVMTSTSKGIQTVHNKCLAIHELCDKK